MDFHSTSQERQLAKLWRSTDDIINEETRRQPSPSYFNTPDGDAMLYHADIEDGTRLFHGAREQSWKITKVLAYSSDMGNNIRDPTGLEPTKKPFHHDYRHYKYFGFAGKGAKTSWGYNPKYSEIYNELQSISSTYASMATPVVKAPPPVPLRETMDGPRRPLTQREKELIRFFRNHSHSYEGKPSLDPASTTGILKRGVDGPEVTTRQLQKARMRLP